MRSIGLKHQTTTSKLEVNVCLKYFKYVQTWTYNHVNFLFETIHWFFISLGIKFRLLSASTSSPICSCLSPQQHFVPRSVLLSTGWSCWPFLVFPSHQILSSVRPIPCKPTNWYICKTLILYLESYFLIHVFDPKLENLKVFNPLEWQQLKCLKNTNYWQGRTAKGTFLLWQWNCELANHCENSWHYHAMLKIHTPYDSVIFWCRYMSERLQSPKVLYENIYNIQKFKTPKLEKNNLCVSIVEWINILWYIHTLEYYSVVVIKLELALELCRELIKTDY